MSPKLMNLMMKYNMSCEEVEEFLMDYLDGNLGFFTSMQFRLHIMMCPDCPKYIENYKNTVALGKSLSDHPDDDSIADIPEEIISAIQRIRKDSHK